MLSYNDFSKIRIGGLYYPLSPYNVDFEILTTESITKDPLGFTELYETQGKYKTLLSPDNSQSIVYQSIIKDKLQVKIYASDTIPAALLKAGQNVTLEKDTGAELLCSVLNVAAEKIQTSNFLTYTADLVVLESDFTNIIRPFNSDVCENTIAGEPNIISLEVKNITYSKFFDSGVVSGDFHNFEFDFKELAAVLNTSDNVTITSYDKRNEESNGVAGVIEDITGDTILITFEGAGATFYPSSFEFAFDIDLTLEFNTLVQPTNKIIKAESEKIEVDGAKINGKNSTFKAKEIVLFLNDYDRDLFVAYYDNSDVKLTLSDGTEFIAIYNPDYNLVEDSNLIDCNPIILLIPTSNTIF